jgi:hypothetical protein
VAKMSVEIFSTKKIVFRAIIFFWEDSEKIVLSFLSFLIGGVFGDVSDESKMGFDI